MVPSHDGLVTAAQVSAEATAFYQAHDVQFSAPVSLDSMLAAGMPTAPVTIITCTAPQLPAVVRTLFRQADTVQSDSSAITYGLLAVIDITRPHGPPPPPTEDSLQWLRPEPSYLSEWTQTTGRPCARTEFVVVPVHMYSNYPLTRDGGPVGEATTTSNICTLEAILRELAFKAGHLPKYGA